MRRQTQGLSGIRTPFGNLGKPASHYSGKAFQALLITGVVVCLCLPAVHVMGAVPEQSTCTLAVLSEPSDPYYTLAEEIAAAENAPLVADITSALACRPVFLLWIAAPESLSDPKMIAFGKAIKNHPTAISSGLITGSTRDAARALWKRRHQVNGQRMFAANAPNPAAHIYTGELREVFANQVSTQPLTKTNLASALQDAAYVTFTGHGASRYLRLDKDIQLFAADVPTLDAVVVSTGSCETVKPWREDSIALRFIDQGAAAYAGFVFSPNEGFLMGEFDGLPFRYTWPDFPIGHVIQVQNHGTLQGFAQFPYHILLGDPRISFLRQPPYQLVNDRQQGDQRILSYANVPAGVVPIRIPNGAGYDFVEAAGISAASYGDPFYNSNLQMANIGPDKFILLAHPGGDLTLRLMALAPLAWMIGDLTLDSLDDTFLFSPQSEGDKIALAFAILPLAWVGWRTFKRRLDRSALRAALLIGLGAALLHAVYIFLRLNHITTISKTVIFSPLSLVTTFLLTTCGALMFFQARSIAGKGMALLVITFPIWSIIVFALLVMAVFNQLFFQPEFGASLYNYSLGLLPLPSLLIIFALAVLTLSLVEGKMKTAKKVFGIQ